MIPLLGKAVIRARLFSGLLHRVQSILVRLDLLHHRIGSVLNREQPFKTARVLTRILWQVFPQELALSTDGDQLGN